jgi:hypothetical protein
LLPFLNVEAFSVQIFAEVEDMSSWDDIINMEPSLLLHMALQSFPSYDTIIKIIAVEPNLLLVQDTHGNLPIHIAIINAVGDDIILELLNAYPESVKVKNNNGHVPFYSALFSNSLFASNLSCSTRVIKKLIDLYPEICEESYQGVCYPLHICCRNRSEPEVLRHIIAACPRSPTLYADASLPIHIACGVSQLFLSLEKVDILLRAFPDGVKVANSQSCYPIHLLSLHLIPTEFYTKVIKLYPMACQMPNIDLNFPLHILCMNYPTVGNVKALLAVYPEAAKLRNSLGLLPIQLLLTIQANKLQLLGLIDITSMLLKIFPQSALAHTEMVSASTLTVAIEKSIDPLIIRMLVNAYQVQLAPNLPKYRELNWAARKSFIEVLIQLKSSESVQILSHDAIADLIQKLCSYHEVSFHMMKIESELLKRIAYFL